MTGGRSSAAFLSEILKFGLALPDAILNHRAPNRSHESFLMLTVPLTNGTLRLNVGDAIVSGTKAILLDTTFSTENMIEPTAVMATLGSAHSVIHDIFMQLTKPIHQLMQPEQ